MMRTKKLFAIFLTAALCFTLLCAQPSPAMASGTFYGDNFYFGVTDSSAWGGMVSFNFDDGYLSVYNLAFPIFQKYGLVGCFFPVVEYLVDNQPWAVNWSQLAEMQQAGWEIGSHTMNHPYLTTLTDAQLDYELKESQSILAQHGFTAKTLVFPYNDFDARVLDYTTRYYENSRGGVGVNGFDCNRYQIVSQEVSSHVTPEQAMAWIDDAVKNKKWLVLMMHQIDTGPPHAPDHYNVNDLEKIVAYAASLTIPNPTMQQALASRQASLGPNLIKNPNLENLDASGWATDWTRNSTTKITVAPATVPRVFSTNNRLKIAGSFKQNTASTAAMKLPDNNQRYFLNFFTEVNIGAKGGTEMWLDEFDKNGVWISGQWLGGFYANTFAMPGYLYQPSSQQVDRVMIDFYSLAKQGTMPPLLLLMGN
ncbi:MAG: polysaccharide deacetylase family protein [Desulfobaccales bacterium]